MEIVIRYPVIGIILFLFHFCSSTGKARTWYVLPDSTGDAPTIQAAIDSSTGGDSVLVAAGFYHVNLVIDWLFNFTLISEDGPETTILDGDPIYNPDRAQVIRCSDASNVLIEGFTIQNGKPEPSESDFGGGIRIGGNGPVTISNNIIQANENEYGAAIGFKYPCNGCEGSRIKGNQILNNISDNISGGIYGAPVTGPIYVTDNYFEGNVGEYACVRFEWITCDLSNNICTGNTSTKYCLSSVDAVGQIHDNYVVNNIGGGISTIDGNIYKNTVSGNTWIGLTILNGEGHNNISTDNKVGITCYQSALSCNNAWGNVDKNWDTYSPSCDTVGSAGNISANPLFCSPTTGDYSISSESPCAPANSGGCGLIGAIDVGCIATSVPTGHTQQSSWGEIKKIFR